MRGSVRSWSGFLFFGAIGACSNIIGVSELEIDRSLDAGGGGEKGGVDGSGGRSEGGENGTPEGGALPGTSGAAEGGGAQGGQSGGTGGKGGSASSGEGGMGGELAGQDCATDCDDEIACTNDACVDGECVHTADDSACEAASCETCRVGIGCVAGAMTTTELLLDGGFDEQGKDWENNSSAEVVVADAGAHSGSHSAYFGPAPSDAVETEFFDILQHVYIPPRTVKLTASGFYKMVWAATELEERPRSAEYAMLSLWPLLPDENDDYIAYYHFHSWDAEKGPAQTTWKAFTYDASKSALSKVRDLEVTLDFVAETWDTVYYFDSVSLKATVCE